MRLLLIDPQQQFDVYGESLATAPVCPSLTLASLAGAAREAGHEVRILDLRKQSAPDDCLREHLRRWKPAAVGLSAFTMMFPAVKHVASLVRSELPEALLIAGGVHPTARPEQMLRDTVFDAVVVGEGEQTLCEILTGKPFTEILGMYYRNGESFTQTPPRPLQQNLDELPMPAYDLFDLDQYDVPTILWKRSRIAMIETSRGCPFNCSFCSSRLVFGRSWRAKSPDRVMHEINQFLDWGFEEIHFQDDGFSTDLPRAKEICRRIMASVRPFPWELFNGIRTDRMDEEFLALAAKAGCYRIRYGVESGSQKVLDTIGKGTKLDEIREAFRLTHRQDIETIALFIFGLPNETPETMDETIRFACSLPADFARVSILCPYPGTRLFDQWEKENRILSDSWADFHFYSVDNLLYEHPTLSKKQIQDAYSRFYIRFYLRPAYLFERLRLGLRRRTLRRDLRYFVRKFFLDVLKRKVL